LWHVALLPVADIRDFCRRVEALHMLAFQLCHEAQWHLDKMRHEQTQ
jgi:hypothetical protein